MSPGPLSIPLGPFQIFSKIHEANRELIFVSCVNDTGDKKEKNFEISIFFFIFFYELS
jgi:hypothetical protein